MRDMQVCCFLENLDGWAGLPGPFIHSFKTFLNPSKNAMLFYQARDEFSEIP